MENNEQTPSVPPQSEPVPESPVAAANPKWKLPLLATISAIVIIGAGAGAYFYFKKQEAEGGISSPAPVTHATSPVFFQKALVDVPFVRQDIKMNPGIAASFPLSDIQNVKDMEKAYGFTFTQDELKKLSENKFVIKNLLDTNIGSNLSVADNMREFVALYMKVAGSSDYKTRTQANSVFISSDVLYNLFSILSADLLKETENKYLFTQSLAISKMMYEKADANYKASTSPADQKDWMKLREYFAIPYALLFTSVKPMSASDYWDSEYQKRGLSLDEAQAEFRKKDADIDSYENTETFIKNLHLPNEEEVAVLADLKQIYDAANSRGTPVIFQKEVDDLHAKSNIDAQIPFTLFKPRGTYTSSSLRRQYFRAIQWYQQIPFLLASNDLARYSVEIGEMLHSDKAMEDAHVSLSSLIAFVVGESDDLDASDLVAAATDLGKEKSRDPATLAAYLNARKPGPKIKALPVGISSPDVTYEQELSATRGMRFMSQKFIPDSYWTSRLTQGDEAPAVNGKKLSDKASSLEVMSILGSPYATSRLSDLPFYAEHKDATDERMKELTTEASVWNEDYWRSNLYTSTLWTISGMYSWLEANRAALPEFMHSPLWNSKTLLTNAGFWTELRHTSLLYAKQSFAEKGGGGDDTCDTRKVPDPAKGYIEPQAEGYDRLLYTATRLKEEYKARGFVLQNTHALDNYIDLLNTIREYTKLELENTQMAESTTTQTVHSYDDNKDCVVHIISPESKVASSNAASRWEDIRVVLISKLYASLPSPVEGPILEIKDKRTAVVADIHTDKDGGVLEEGTGVPRVIFVAVKDVNGPRLTVGFTYSQYETISSERLTDEKWQDNFYIDNGNYLITYKPKAAWPDVNTWFQELLGNK